MGSRGVGEFLCDARRDFEDMRHEFPYAEFRVPPAVPPRAEIDVVAASADLINTLRATREDFVGEYSRELNVIARPHYQTLGCEVYGADWIDLGAIDEQDWHFFDGCRVTERGYRLCVGVPQSFAQMDNVILESVRTAAHMLIAYERVMRGESRRLELFAYPHGPAGVAAYRRDVRRCLPGNGRTRRG